MQDGHILIVGGTGMLRPLVYTLASRVGRLSVIARSVTRLESLANETAGAVIPLRVDYSDSGALAEALRAREDEHGPFTEVIAWIHSTAPDAPQIIADAVDPTTPLLQVLGSSAHDPDRRSPLPTIERVPFRRVILGFVVEADGSRWLTDDEICQGVLTARASNEIETIVGTVEPWSDRPPL